MKDATNGVSPTSGLWLRFLVLIPVVIVMFFVSNAYIRSVCSTYQAWSPVYQEDVSFAEFGVEDVSFSNLGVIEATNVEHFPTGAARVTFRALREGETDVTFGSNRLSTYWSMRVQDGAIIADGVNFTGWESIHICLCVFFAIVSFLFVSALVRLVRANWYGYEMVACGGGLVFCLFQCVLFVFLYMNDSLRSFYDMAWMLGNMADWFALVSLMPMSILALLVTLSNIALIRHEGLRPVNLLGIVVSIVWILANYAWRRLAQYGVDFGWDLSTIEFMDSVLAVGITFGECLLLSTIVCAWLASRHEPKRNKDYLIVLGCGIRADGTPSPLLAGRVDRARAFDEKRVAAGDRSATFVPSGGQGPDEAISEAESMANYLQAQGVSRDRIVLELKSATTRENMAFSREVIETHAHKDASEVTVGFSTTNYHVFRGYVCAHQAGMAVEGMGSKTKAYFWPNAFLREFVGLLATQWKGIIQTFLIIGLVYAAAEYILVLS